MLFVRRKEEKGNIWKQRIFNNIPRVGYQWAAPWSGIAREDPPPFRKPLLYCVGMYGDPENTGDRAELEHDNRQENFLLKVYLKGRF